MFIEQHAKVTEALQRSHASCWTVLHTYFVGGSV